MKNVKRVLNFKKENKERRLFFDEKNINFTLDF
jgi:hypothetical protein